MSKLAATKCETSVAVEDTCQEPELMQVLCCNTVIIPLLKCSQEKSKVERLALKVKHASEFTCAAETVVKETGKTHVDDVKDNLPVLCPNICVNAAGKTLLTCQWPHLTSPFYIILPSGNIWKHEKEQVDEPLTSMQTSVHLSQHDRI